jgi:signal transduction histidine kinase/CheY-like chemotaxis protein
MTGGVQDYRTLFASSPDAYLVLAPDLTIVEVTDAYLKATMTDRDEIIGRGLFEIFPDNPDDSTATGMANLAASLERVLANGRPDTMAVQKYDIQRPASEGGGFEERYWSPVNCPVLGSDGEVELIIHRVEDVTELIQLKQKGSEQEDEIYRRAQEIQAINQELRTANERLAELDHAKTNFFSNVSHELRTPLTLLIGPIEDLLADSERVRPASERAWLELASRNAHRLLKHVNTLLDFTRIEGGSLQPNFEATDLARLTSELASSFEPACARAGIALIVDCPPLPEPAYVDREQWEKIVLNLVSNAFKHTFAGELAVTLRPRSDEIELAIRDTGVGISANELPHVFERFHRVAGARARTHEGSGIGLALVKELVAFHGGDVAIESEVGVGTTVAVRIPRGARHVPADQVGAPSRPQTAVSGTAYYAEEALRWTSGGDTPGEPIVAPHASAAAAASSGGVLVAEDNDDMREYLVGLLREHWNVRAVADGAAALEAARVEPPDLVLSDVMMPGLDGFELVAALRAESETRAVPVVLLTARVGEQSTVEGLESGADDYVVKPFSARELIARVRTHIELSRQRAELAREQAARAAAERMAHRLENLQAVSDAALGRLGLDDLLRVTVARIGDIVGADAAVIAFPNGDGHLAPRAAFGLELDATAFSGRLANASRPLALEPAPPLAAVVGVPLFANAAVGELYVGRVEARPFADDEVQLLQVAAERVAIAIEQTQLVDQEQQIAKKLHRALVPDRLPEFPGMEIAVRHFPVRDATEVGGDWCELVPLADGRLGLAIGEVAGRGEDTARLAAQLRPMLRAYALEHGAPGEVVGRLDQLVRCLDETRLATLVYAVLDPRESSVRLTTAGHLPPLVIRPDGDAWFPEVSRSRPLGIGVTSRPEDEIELEPGSTLVLYTDGLVARRGRPLPDGLECLAGAARALLPDAGVEEVCARLAGALLDAEASDDAALVVARVLPSADHLEVRLPAEPASLAVLRQALTRWLDAAGVSAAEVGAMVLGCSEAAANVVEHAYGPDGGELDLRANLLAEEVVFEIRDRGSWRERGSEDHGRGTGLMGVVMDDVEVETGDAGTTVTLRKRLVREEVQKPSISSPT